MKFITLALKKENLKISINVDKIISIYNDYDDKGDIIGSYIIVNGISDMPRWAVVLSILFGFIWFFVYRCAVGNKKYYVKESRKEVLEKISQL